MKNRLSGRAFFPFLLGISLMTATGSAQFMLSPVAVSDDNVTTFSDAVPVTNLINQSGITTLFTSGVTVFDTYFANPELMWATSGSGGTNNWHSESAFDLGPQGHLDFDLGAVYQINKLAIWNRSLRDVTVKVLNDLAGPEQVAGSFTLVDRQNFTFDYPVDLISFDATYEGRYVRLVIDSIYEVQNFGFGSASAGEVVASVLPLGASLPKVSAVLDPNGDVTVTFTGTLQTSTTINGIFTNVPENPSSPYILPGAGLLRAQYFRAAGD